MTSDIDNDEILDSAFPVEFKDEGTPLDMYGVWVKSGPRDASSVSPAPLAMNRTETETVSAVDLPDINDLPELPDFETISVDTAPVIEEIRTDGDSYAIEDLPEFGDMSPIEETHVDEELPAIEEVPEFGDMSPIEETHVDEELPAIEEVPEFGDMSPVDTIPTLEEIPENAEIPIFELQPESISFEEIRPDSMEHAEIETKTPLAGESSDKKDFSDFDFNVVDASEFFGNDSGLETIQEAESIDTIESIETTEFVGDKLDADMSFDDILPEELKATPEVEITEAVAPETTESPDADETFESISMDSFAEIPSAEKPVSDSSSSGMPVDDDFNDFLENLNSDIAEVSPRPASGDDTFDLDSFVDSFNETGGVSHEDDAKVYDDIEPVDLELEFDESFIEDAEKIRATGSAVSESEFFNSEFGVELIDETNVSIGSAASPGNTANFDEMFDSIEMENTVPATGTIPVSFEETREFDDLLQSLEMEPVPTQSKKEVPSAEKKMKSFDLSVTDEDGFTALQSSITENADSEDIDVPLLDTAPQEAVAESAKDTYEEILDIPVIRDYNTTESELVSGVSLSSTVDETVLPDFDDISAVEQELNDLTPDTGDDTVVTSDKSTELLMIIADELSSIKKELTTLKSEISSFKSAAASTESVISPEKEITNENSGFFSDDDTDETIALTGDELNNILITADFTEEKNESPDTPEAAESVISGFEESEIPETLPDSIFEAPQPDTADSFEVSHINQVNEDISYLEGQADTEPELDNVAIEEPELETIDFNDEKLEEPELTEFNIDLSEIEESFSAGQDVPVPEEEFAPKQEIPVEEMILEPVLEQEPAIAPEPTALPVTPAEEVTPSEPAPGSLGALPVDLKNEIKSVLSYMDQLLESLPEEKIEEFAKSEHFEVYKKLFEELGIS